MTARPVSGGERLMPKGDRSVLAVLPQRTKKRPERPRVRAHNSTLTKAPVTVFISILQVAPVDFCWFP